MAGNNSYDPATPAGLVRLLLNDVSAPWIFTNAEIEAFLTLEGQNVKRAAAQAIDANASNEALASKVLKSQDLSTDGAKVADALRKHAASLREQADVEADDDGYFGVVDMVGHHRPPELTTWPWP